LKGWLVVTISDLRAHIGKLPRVKLGHLPTPLECCPRLSEALGGPEIFIKRDDCTGLAFGGNKTRQLEFTIAQGLERGADVLIGGAGSQSNHCRQLSAAAAKLGVDCALAMVKDHKSGTTQGNLLLDDLFGASVDMIDVETQELLDEAKDALVNRLTREGRKPFTVMQKANRPYGAMGYALCMAEILEQCEALGKKPTTIILCSGSCTQPGLIFGKKMLGIDTRIMGIAPIVWSYDIQTAFLSVLNKMSDILGVDLSFDVSDIENTSAYVGEEGYGYCTAKGNAAVRLMAEKEGILLEPIYTGKTMAGLIDLIQKGDIGPDETVVFVHTGGTPALFAYSEELLEDK
jgi:1-aminocyclopropane-1-carboxylate deaminase/D-cysteine desulfhydrase-like pyridoxal-dependent ACC family enzyme